MSRYDRRHRDKSCDKSYDKSKDNSCNKCSHCRRRGYNKCRCSDKNYYNRNSYRRDNHSRKCNCKHNNSGYSRRNDACDCIIFDHFFNPCRIYGPNYHVDVGATHDIEGPMQNDSTPGSVLDFSNYNTHNNINNVVNPLNTGASHVVNPFVFSNANLNNLNNVNSNAFFNNTLNTRSRLGNRIRRFNRLF